MAYDFTFTHRTRSYKASVIALVVSTLVIVVGYATPHWVDCPQGSYGLWLECGLCEKDKKTSAQCNSHDGSNTQVDDILRVPQILSTLEVTALVLGSVMAVLVNVRRYVPRRPRQRHFEVFAGVAGLLGFVGGTVFWVNKAKMDKTDNAQTIPGTLSWSFFLLFLPSLLCVVASVVISCGKDFVQQADQEGLQDGQQRGDGRRPRRRPR